MRDRMISMRVPMSGMTAPFTFCVLLILLAVSATGARAEGGASFQGALIAQNTQEATTQDRARQIAAADTEIRVAQDELQTARRRFEAGRKPAQTDRVNQLEGGGAHTDAYYLRVEQLKANVTKAQERLDRAIVARKAIGG